VQKCYPIYFSFFAKTSSNIAVGHPFSKPHPVKSILSEHVFKKCVKQVTGDTFQQVQLNGVGC
ncbi:MAG TPA: hypothetical protein VN722_04500, partial [Hanamia sp.]|nr:hypothetical protein [Hanamia sp.]